MNFDGIEFDCLVRSERENTTTLYFTAPEELLYDLIGYDYVEAEHSEISIEFPTGNRCVKDSTVMVSPTRYNEEDDGYEDYDWRVIWLSGEDIERLFQIADEA